jgi:hypothetical protein
LEKIKREAVIKFQADSIDEVKNIVQQFLNSRQKASGAGASATEINMTGVWSQLDKIENLKQQVQKSSASAGASAGSETDLTLTGCVTVMTPVGPFQICLP